MAEGYEDGITRTSSGRQTYAPDGLSSLGHSTSGQEAPEQSRAASISGTTTAHSTRSSISGPRGSKEDNDQDQKPKNKTGLPAGLTAGLNEENFSSEADVEMQRERTNRSLNEKDDEKDEGEEEENDPNLVDWDGPDDPGNPMNFPAWKKWLITVVAGLMTFSVTFASSVFSTATTPTSQEFGVSTEVMILGTSLFVLGFAFGPIVWSPFSELFGRKLPLFIGFFIFAIFQIPVAVAQNLETIFICRFLGGFAASAPLGIVGGLLADIFGPIDRGIAVAVFASATFVGPVAGPIVGGFITMSHLGWRWTAWITLIMAGFFGLIGFVVIPETLAPVLLSRRAKKIRFATKNWAVHAKADENEVNMKELAHRYLLKPFQMLAMEPILLLVTLYMGFIYGFLYLCFEAYPIAFQQERGWNAGVGALPFAAIIVGVAFGSLFICFFTKTRFARKMKEHGEVVPEERMIPMIVGGALLPIGMFWFAWTSNPDILWVPQVISGAFIGAGVLLVFLQGLNYIIDVYKVNANSAIAANTFFRSWLGAGFPMFATSMFNTLGVPWAMSLLGFLTLALFPVPILFFIYGEKIRKLSKFSA
ncbi:MFS general substrate transporter [Aureobasidium pullulans]|nr:MFS general substrate transporter [Aureobasidium pullulans]